MRHTGGLRDPMMAAFLINGGSFGHIPAGSSLRLMALFTERNFMPGQGMVYCNGGYTLLSLVIERVSGRLLEDYLSEHVFAPLGMHDSMLLRSDLHIVPNMATLHVAQPDGSWRRGVYPTDDLMGSGGIISTVDDMLRWAAHLRSAQKVVGNAATWAKMLERQTYRSGKQAGYGLGIAVENHRGVTTISHSGSTIGSQCQMVTLPAHALDIVVLFNRMDQSAHALAVKILETVLERELLEPMMPSPVADFPALPGRWYCAHSRTLMSIAPQRSGLELPEAMLLSLFNAPTAFLHKLGDGLAIPEGPMSSLEIRMPPRGEVSVTRLDLDIAGELQCFERLPDTPPTVDELAPMVTGRYCYTEFGKDVEIRMHDGKLILDLLPRFGFSHWGLEIYSEDVLACGSFHSHPAFALPVFASIVLERSEGRIMGFWLSTDRMRDVRFDRC